MVNNGLKTWHFILGMLPVIVMLVGMIWQYAQLSEQVSNLKQEVGEIRQVLILHAIEHDRDSEAKGVRQ